jgi:hypothetical protein
LRTSAIPSAGERQGQRIVLEQPKPSGLDASEDILHEISTLLIQEGNLDALYDHILDAAMGLMSSDMPSIQLLDPEGSQLRLLRWKGFHP